MKYRRLFCLKRLFVVVGITLVLINFHIVINSPNSLQNIFDMGFFIKPVSTVILNKTTSDIADPKTENAKTNGAGKQNKYSLFLTSIIFPA